MLIDRRQEGRRRIIQEGHRFNAVHPVANEGFFEQAVDRLSGNAGNIDFFRPGDEAGILGRRLIDGKGKGEAQLIGLIAAGSFFYDSRNEVKQGLCRRRRRRIVVIVASQRFRYLGFNRKSVCTF